VEYAVYGAPGELPELPALEAAAGGALVEVQTSEVAEDWPERWREFHRPVLVGERLWVRPPWQPPSEREGAIDLAIEPARAFGTGAHATTRLCLGLLLELEPAGALVDLGCGSGVLAIAAARLGFGPVLAVDLARAALEATAANAEANGVAVEARTADLSREPPPAAATVVANIPASVHVEIAPRLAELPRLLVATAIRIDNVEPVVEAYAARGLVESSRRVEATWVVLTLAPRSPSST
jgi:ribosomal protein L11 methyltransferase